MMTAADWYDRAIAEDRAGQPAMFFEIHEACGGVVLGARSQHPRIRVCDCEGVTPTYSSARELIARHGLEEVARWILPPSEKVGAGRYG